MIAGKKDTRTKKKNQFQIKLKEGLIYFSFYGKF